jgi:hypothetical protein
MTIEEEAAGIIARYLAIVLNVDERCLRAAVSIIRALNEAGIFLVKK